MHLGGVVVGVLLSGFEGGCSEPVVGTACKRQLVVRFEKTDATLSGVVCVALGRGSLSQYDQPNS